MYVKVRTIDGNAEKCFDISKLITVEDFKTKVSKEFTIASELQRLFYRGKQLEDGYKIFHYGVGPSDVLQLTTKLQINERTSSDPSTSSDCDSEEIVPSDSSSEAKTAEQELEESTSLHYDIGDPVDCLDRSYGAWFEATIVKILSKDSKSLVYEVKWNFVEDEEPFQVSEDMIRPRARKLISYAELAVGHRVMVNYNTDSPVEDGFWYDLTVTKIRKTRTVEELTGTLHIGSDDTTVENCKLNPKGEIYAIEEPKLLKDRSLAEVPAISNKRRRVALICKSCMDDAETSCKDCGCWICSGKDEPQNLLLCDECNKAHHLSCLDPPLSSIPQEDNWYCPSCKNDENEIVKAGEKLKPSKKKTNTTELKQGQKDWGMGMACLGRTAECTIVPQNHIGPIPGIEVGMSWEYRLQVSEVGVHRPHVAGIHGREAHCAYSIVLSGGYEDDVDHGDEFIYTGSGGRDLSGNKRTAVQSCDQTLTRMNKALALNCIAKLNTVKGASAGTNWRAGIPVRVVRSFKLRRRSEYAPTAGNRYDGIYKVVKYFPKKGKSGFSVWRYQLRRDDPSPAPWTTEGRERMEALGLTMIAYKTIVNGNESNSKGDRKVENAKEGEKTMKHRKRSSKAKIGKINNTREDEEPEVKKMKRETYELQDQVTKLIKEDSANFKLWDECCDSLVDGKIVFLQLVAERYTCVCCQEVVNNPVTTPCSHNICLNCIKRSFRAGVYCCPTCRHPMKKNHTMVVNDSLSSALKILFPGYGGGR